MELSAGVLLQFLQNLCLFTAIVLSYRETIRLPIPDWQRSLLLGLVFGAAAGIGALLPVTLPSGYYVDAELIPLGLAALFGGPISGIAAIAVANVFQAFFHGADVLEHMMEPTAAAFAGAGFLLFQRRRQRLIGLPGFLFLGGLLIAMTIAEPFLLADQEAMRLVATTLVYIVPSGLAGTAILGFLLRREDRRLARERTHAQESKMLEAVVDSMSDGLLAIDTEGKALVFNKPAREMLGDWRGDRYATWKEDYKRYHMDGKTPMEWDALALPRALQGLETNDLTVIVKSPKRPNGFVISVNGRPLRDDSGKVIAGITVARDVSELMSAQQHLAESQAALKRSEERYALAFEGAYDGLWDRDLRTGQAFFSARCFEIVGTPKMADSAGRTADYGWWTDRIHPEDSMRVLEAREASLKGGGLSFEIEYRIRRTNGTYCWISDRGAISRDKFRFPYRVAGSFTDISARKLAEEQRRILETQLQQVQKTEALGTLAGGVAHDINNTLVPIIGIVDLLLSDAPKEGDLHENLEDVMSAAIKVQQLVRQILAFSRQETTDRHAIDMKEELASTLRMLRSMVPATIALDFTPAQDHLVCKVNSTQLYQVIMNLVSNAVGAIGGNKGAIRISVDRIEVTNPATIAVQEVDGGWFCRIAIIDTGPGIPAEIEPRLFDPFFTTKPVGEGTGLGLSVVQGIVRDHGGFILVSNQSGEGARFDVHFPLVDQGDMALGARHQRQHPAPRVNGGHDSRPDRAAANSSNASISNEAMPAATTHSSP